MWLDDMWLNGMKQDAADLAWPDIPLGKDDFVTLDVHFSSGDSEVSAEFEVCLSVQRQAKTVRYQSYTDERAHEFIAELMRRGREHA